jgi:galactoside O-acetyltransferase
MALARLINAIRILALKSHGAWVGRGSHIGRHVRCSANVRIGENAIIGDEVCLNGNIEIGRGVRIEKHVEMHGNIGIGDGSVVGAFSMLSTLPEGALTIGSDVYVNAFSVIGAARKVTIGDQCIFAAFVQITDATHGFDDPNVPIKHAPFRTSPVQIGQGVWLGSGVMVTKGVSIGSGSVIGAKALVTKDIPPMSIAYGIPARHVRSRAGSQEGKA